MKKLLGSILLIVAIALYALPVALADEVRVKTDTLCLRVEPSEKADSLGTVKKGTILTQVSVSGNWVKVTYRGDTGYVPKQSVTLITEAEVDAAVRTDSIRTGGAKLYKSASATSTVLSILKKGTSVRVYGTKNGWVRVTYHNTTGYIQERFFTEKQTDATPEPSVTPAPTASKGVTRYVNLASLTLYSSANSKSKRIGSLPYGTAVTVYGTSGNWKKVVANGKRGYVYGKYLVSSAPTPAPTGSVDAYTTLQSGSSGGAVKTLQARLIELGYLAGTPDGNYGDKTVAAVKKYQNTAKLAVTGIADVDTQKSIYSSGAPEAPIAPSATSEPVSVKGVVAVDWFTGNIQTAFPVGKVVTVTDVATGISWQEKRTGGWYHADCQPLTSADTAKMLKACGKWSWERRAIWVTIDGVTYAASMNCMPHDGDSMPDNDFDGCHCLHFINSKVHGRNCVDAAHQAAIQRALDAAK